MRGAARDDADVAAQPVLRRQADDIDDIGAIAHAHVDRKVEPVPQVFQRRACNVEQVERAKVLEAQRQHVQAELEGIGVRRSLQVSVGFQRVRQAKCGGARHAEFAHDLRQGHDPPRARKQAQHRQSAAQRRDDIALAVIAVGVAGLAIVDRQFGRRKVFRQRFGRQVASRHGCFPWWHGGSDSWEWQLQNG